MALRGGAGKVFGKWTIFATGGLAVAQIADSLTDIDFDSDDNTPDMYLIPTILSQQSRKNLDGCSGLALSASSQKAGLHVLERHILISDVVYALREPL